MISARQAMLRQAQEYFHMLLLGAVKWDDVVVDKAIPVPAVRGNREQGKTRDVVTAHFNGFRLEMMSPFEEEQWPLGKIKVTKGHHSVHGPLDGLTWLKVANFIVEQKKQTGEDNGASDSSSTTDYSAGEHWGR